MVFIDDTLLVGQGKTLAESNDKVRDMMEREGSGMGWFHTHQCSFMLR